ncbi:hypothetical protein HYV85_05690 [Candidatus Woesearchaeota archaeon]|nr:hypothetical protein [Candidatus Woesearchaeota archaeon]
MVNEETLRKLEGLHTVETAARTLNLTRQSTINLLSKLKNEGYVTVNGGGKQPRLYRIMMRKQRPRSPGMFDIINKYSPMKLAPWYDHQVHGHYGPEEAVVDAIQMQSFRAILASMRLFNHITDWPRLYRLAREKGVWQKVGALYDVAGTYFHERKMPLRYRHPVLKKKESLIRDYPTELQSFLPIEQKWNVAVPFRRGDIAKVMNV